MCFSYFSSVAQLYPILCDPMHRSTPGLSVHHKLLEFTQTHAHRVSDAIQPSLSLSPPSPPAPNPSQHQGLFQWVNSSHEVAKVLELCLHRAKKCDNFLIMPSSPSFLKLFLFIKLIYFSYCCSVTQLCLTLCNPMNSSTPGLPVQQRSIQSRLWFFQWSNMDVRVGLWRKLRVEELMLLNFGVGEDSWESLGLQGVPPRPS